MLPVLMFLIGANHEVCDLEEEAHRSEKACRLRLAFCEGGDRAAGEVGRSRRCDAFARIEKQMKRSP